MKIFREETFGPVAPLIRFKRRRRGRRAREPHRVRARVVLLQPRHRPHLARRRGARIRHGRRQHRPHHHRGRAVRRREAIGPRPRRLASTASRSSSRSSTSASAASTVDTPESEARSRALVTSARRERGINRAVPVGLPSSKARRCRAAISRSGAGTAPEVASCTAPMPADGPRPCTRPCRGRGNSGCVTAAAFARRSVAVMSASGSPWNAGLTLLTAACRGRFQLLAMQCHCSGGLRRYYGGVGAPCGRFRRDARGLRSPAGRQLLQDGDRRSSTAR